MGNKQKEKEEKKKKKIGWLGWMVLKPLVSWWWR